jgi:hypothetical protein
MRRSGTDVAHNQALGVAAQRILQKHSRA